MDHLTYSVHQGYIAGLFSVLHADIDKLPAEILNNSYKFTAYERAIKYLEYIKDKVQHESFKHGASLGIHNAIFIHNQDRTNALCSCRLYNCIKELSNYDSYKHITNTKGKLLASVRIGHIDQLVFLFTVRPGSCDRCGFEKFCHCFSHDTPLNYMCGIDDKNLGTHVCTKCGIFKYSIYYKTNYMCEECAGEDKVEIQDRLIDETKQVFYKDKLCIICSEKPVDCKYGLEVCSRYCLHEILQKIRCIVV